MLSPSQEKNSPNPHPQVGLSHVTYFSTERLESAKPRGSGCIRPDADSTQICEDEETVSVGRGDGVKPKSLPTGALQCAR